MILPLYFFCVYLYCFAHLCYASSRTMNTTNQPIDIRFIALMALMMSMVALGIDVMLPAMQVIGDALDVQDPNDNQLIISAMFFGLAVGQLFFGPISDTIGRKPSVYAGFILFTIGIAISVFSTSLTVMLVGRLLQGLGLAAFRVVCLAIIRDQYAGNQMARVASFIMTIFIIVPTVAPLIGQQILVFGTWQTIFYFLFFAALAMIIWFAAQQPETLAVDKRIPLTFRNVRIALREIFGNPIAFSYTLISGLFGGAFLGFLNTSQQVFEFQYNLGGQFPLYFAIVAITMGVASTLNGQLVRRYDMHDIAWVSMIIVLTISSAAGLYHLFIDTYPSLWQYMGMLLMIVFFTGLLFGNVNSIAMNPLGRIAGFGAAVIGAISTFLMVIVGGTIGQLYTDNTGPIFYGYLFCSILAMALAWRVKQHTNAAKER